MVLSAMDANFKPKRAARRRMDIVAGRRVRDIRRRPAAVEKKLRTELEKTCALLAPAPAPAVSEGTGRLLVLRRKKPDDKKPTAPEAQASNVFLQSYGDTMAT